MQVGSHNGFTRCLIDHNSFGRDGFMTVERIDAATVSWKHDDGTALVWSRYSGAWWFGMPAEPGMPVTRIQAYPWNVPTESMKLAREQAREWFAETPERRQAALRA